METTLFNTGEAHALPPIDEFLKADCGYVIDFLVNDQHVRLRSDMTSLRHLVAQVQAEQSRPSTDLDRMAKVLADFEEVVLDHINREEQIVFPLICILEGRGALPLYSRMNIQSPVIRLESDHDETVSVFESFRELTDGYRAPETATSSYNALVTGLAEFEALLRNHISVERHALFARICEKICSPFYTLAPRVISQLPATRREAFQKWPRSHRAVFISYIPHLRQSPLYATIA